MQTANLNKAARIVLDEKTEKVVDVKNNRGPQIKKLPNIEFKKATEADIAIENCMLRAWLFASSLNNLDWLLLWIWHTKLAATHWLLSIIMLIHTACNSCAICKGKTSF